MEIMKLRQHPGRLYTPQYSAKAELEGKDLCVREHIACCNRLGCARPPDTQSCKTVIKSPAFVMLHVSESIPWFWAGERIPHKETQLSD